MSIVTKAELARRLDVTRGAVNHYVKRGLPVREDGKIDLAVASIWLDRTIDQRSRKSSADPAPPPPAPPAPAHGKVTLAQLVDLVRGEGPDLVEGRLITAGLAVPMRDATRQLLVEAIEAAIARPATPVPAPALRGYRADVARVAADLRGPLPARLCAELVAQGVEASDAVTAAGAVAVVIESLLTCAYVSPGPVGCPVNEGALPPPAPPDVATGPLRERWDQIFYQAADVDWTHIDHEVLTAHAAFGWHSLRAA